MSKSKKYAMREALQWCDDNDKSTEFTLAFIASQANCTYDEAVEFLISI
jgi:hypothetical protein